MHVDGFLYTPIRLAPNLGQQLPLGDDLPGNLFKILQKFDIKSFLIVVIS